MPRLSFPQLSLFFLLKNTGSGISASKRLKLQQFIGKIDIYQLRIDLIVYFCLWSDDISIERLPSISFEKPFFKQSDIFLGISNPAASLWPPKSRGRPRSLHVIRSLYTSNPSIPLALPRHDPLLSSLIKIEGRLNLSDIFEKQYLMTPGCQPFPVRIISFFSSSLPFGPEPHRLSGVHLLRSYLFLLSRRLWGKLLPGSFFRRKPHAEVPHALGVRSIEPGAIHKWIEWAVIFQFLPLLPNALHLLCFFSSIVSCLKRLSSCSSGRGQYPQPSQELQDLKILLMPPESDYSGWPEQRPGKFKSDARAWKIAWRIFRVKKFVVDNSGKPLEAPRDIVMVRWR